MVGACTRCEESHGLDPYDILCIGFIVIFKWKLCLVCMLRQAPFIFSSFHLRDKHFIQVSAFGVVMCCAVVHRGKILLIFFNHCLVY